LVASKQGLFNEGQNPSVTHITVTVMIGGSQMHVTIVLADGEVCTQTRAGTIASSHRQLAQTVAAEATVQAPHASPKTHQVTATVETARPNAAMHVQATHTESSQLG
jgi:hypothetical protein